MAQAYRKWKQDLRLKVFLTCLLMCAVWPLAAFGQAIQDIAFYQSITEKKTAEGRKLIYPERPITVNTVKLTQLPARDKHRTVYVAATLTSSTSPSNGAFVFGRKVAPGDERCQVELNQIFASPDDLAKLRKPSGWAEEFADFELVRRKIADSISGTEIGYKDIKLKIVALESGERTYYDFRFVSCPGQVQVWVVDQHLNIMPPVENNPGIILNIVE